MKDVVTSYWFNYKMATIELDMPQEEVEERVLKTKFAIIIKMYIDNDLIRYQASENKRRIV